jgi:hypothetical protein
LESENGGYPQVWPDWDILTSGFWDILFWTNRQKTRVFPTYNWVITVGGCLWNYIPTGMHIYRLPRIHWKEHAQDPPSTFGPLTSKWYPFYLLLSYVCWVNPWFLANFFKRPLVTTSFQSKKPCCRAWSMRSISGSQHLTLTLWLCQNSYWKWLIEIVDFPIENGDYP